MTNIKYVIINVTMYNQMVMNYTVKMIWRSLPKSIVKLLVTILIFKENLLCYLFPSDYSTVLYLVLSTLFDEAVCVCVCVCVFLCVWFYILWFCNVKPNNPEFILPLEIFCQILPQFRWQTILNYLLQNILCRPCHENVRRERMIAQEIMKGDL